MDTLRENSPGLTPERLTRVMTSRGIKGVFIEPLSPERTRVELDWSIFAAASMGLHMEQPCIHRSAHNHYQSIPIILNGLEDSGYHRIGVEISPKNDGHFEHAWQSKLIRNEAELRPETALFYSNDMEHRE